MNLTNVDHSDTYNIIIGEQFYELRLTHEDD